MQTRCPHGRPANHTQQSQSLKNWLTVLGQIDPQDTGGILEAFGVVLLLLATRAPRGPESVFTTTTDTKLRRALLELRSALLGRLIRGNVDTATAEHSTALLSHLVELLELETGGRL